MEAYVRKAIAIAGMSQCNSAPTPLIDGLQLNASMAPVTDQEQEAVRTAVNKMFGARFLHHLTSISDKPVLNLLLEEYFVATDK